MAKRAKKIDVQIIGIDPSYRNLAVSIKYGKKKIRIYNLSSKLGDRIDFTKSYIVADALTDRLIDKLYQINKCTTIISEVPAPNMQYTMGLSVLDSLVISKLNTKLEPDNIFTLSPSFLSHLHGTNRYSKKDSETLARHFIELLTEKGYKIDYDGKLNADMSEAFLFMLKGLVITGDELSLIITDELGTFYGDNYKVLYDKYSKYGVDEDE